MSFIDHKQAEFLHLLRSAHFDFPRSTELRLALKNCVTNYYTSVAIGGAEARGLIVTGLSRVGKSQEIRRLIAEFNESSTLMPDDRPAKIVSCVLSGRVSWKDLGIQTLNALGYEIQASRTQTYIWNLVLEQVERQGVIGVHYDECQHVFVEGAKSNRNFLDSFKSMMKETRWPLMLILSGVPTLTKSVQPYEQLSALLDPVHFDEIRFKRDMELLNSLMFAFADKAKVDIEHLVTQEFLERIDHACSHRWGLVIELEIAALVRCQMAGRKKLKVDDFVTVFALKTGIPEAFSPFTVPDFRDAFDPATLLMHLEKS